MKMLFQNIQFQLVRLMILKKHQKKKKNEINDYVQKINNLIKKLNEIALYSNIYENQENYCDYQIKIEKSEM